MTSHLKSQLLPKCLSDGVTVRLGPAAFRVVLELELGMVEHQGQPLALGQVVPGVVFLRDGREVLEILRELVRTRKVVGVAVEVEALGVGTVVGSSCRCCFCPVRSVLLLIFADVPREGLGTHRGSIGGGYLKRT